MISKEKKAAIIEQYGRKAGDTGSPEVPVSYTHLDVYKRQRLCISQILQCVYKCYNLLLLYYKNVKCQAGEPEIGLWERSEVRQVENLFERKQESG